MRRKWVLISTTAVLLVAAGFAQAGTINGTFERFTIQKGQKLMVISPTGGGAEKWIAIDKETKFANAGSNPLVYDGDEIVDVGLPVKSHVSATFVLPKPEVGGAPVATIVQVGYPGIVGTTKAPPASVTSAGTKKVSPSIRFEVTPPTDMVDCSTPVTFVPPKTQDDVNFAVGNNTESVSVKFMKLAAGGRWINPTPNGPEIIPPRLSIGRSAFVGEIYKMEDGNGRCLGILRIGRENINIYIPHE